MNEDDKAYGTWLVNTTRKETVYVGCSSVYKINWVLKLWNTLDEILICSYMDNSWLEEPYSLYKEIDTLRDLSDTATFVSSDLN